MSGENVKRIETIAELKQAIETEIQNLEKLRETVDKESPRDFELNAARLGLEFAFKKINEFEASVKERIKLWEEATDEYRESDIQRYGNVLDAHLEELHKILGESELSNSSTVKHADTRGGK